MEGFPLPMRYLFFKYSNIFNFPALVRFGGEMQHTTSCHLKATISHNFSGAIIIIILTQQQTCVGTLPQGYIRNTPLPRVPSGQSAKSHTQVTTILDYYETPYVVPYDSPRSLVESAAYAFSPAWHAIALNT